MQEILGLSGGSDGIKLDFVEREATPTEIITLGIRRYLVGLSLSTTISVLDILGGSRARSTVHNWVQKAQLEPARA